MITVGRNQRQIKKVSPDGDGPNQPPKAVSNKETLHCI